MAAAFFILLSAHVIHANEGKSFNMNIVFDDVNGECLLIIYFIFRIRNCVILIELVRLPQTYSFL